MKEKSAIRGRGAQINPHNRFLQHERLMYLDDLATQEEREALVHHNPKTKFIEVHPKTIVNRIDSPDLGMAYSLNPYQGCEHGCVYCYARNSHEYWGYSAGADFEQQILIKKNAPDLLRQFLQQKKHRAEMILLSGNTDCYQPAERTFGITRKLLEVFFHFRHPVGIITKNVLIERDVDILKKLAADRLVAVTLSLTTLDESMKRLLEPRTASVRQVLRTVRSLTDAGIPVTVNFAPVIPGLNDHELFDVCRAVKDQGALGVNYIVVRLNGQLAAIFEDWIRHHFPERGNKILNRIKSLHHGKLNDTEWGRRMKGEGEWAELFRRQHALAMHRFFPNRQPVVLNTALYETYRDQQLKLF
ncbi:MAG: PA0069 family radical SAM protein [Chitinophagales bacterium]